MRLSIKYRFAVGFIIIFSLSSFTLNYFLGNQIKKNTSGIIKNDMVGIQKNSREYLKQLFMAEGIKPDENSFEKIGREIVEALSENTNSIASLYTVDGEFVCQSIRENTEISISNDSSSKNPRDIESVKGDRATVHIENVGERLIANFSYPLYIDGRSIGVVRFTKDYTDIYLENKELLNGLTLFTLILFFTALIFSYLLSMKMTTPIENLSKAFSEVADGNYNVEIKAYRNDEIGDLSRDFCFMRDKINEQIETIKLERERALMLEKHRREFFNNVTHELKTPLTSIYGYAQILNEEGFEDREFCQRAIKSIMDESQRLHNMVVELLEVSKKNSYLRKQSYKKIDLRGLVNEILRDMSMKGEKYKIDITSEIDDMYVNGDKNGLRQVFINIIDNAIKYGETGSNIKVKGYKEDGFGILKVENKSEKINEDKMENIFEPFFTAHSTSVEKGSSGLGLYISKEIVKEHRGDIWMESSDNIIKIFVKIPLWK